MAAKDVGALLADLRKAARREECWSCDCLQGFLTQLEMDAEPAAAEVIGPLKVPSTKMHGCLGCDPCPPGAAFADYLRCMSQQAACCANDFSCKNQKDQTPNE